MGLRALVTWEDDIEGLAHTPLPSVEALCGQSAGDTPRWSMFAAGLGSIGPRRVPAESAELDKGE